MATSCFRTMQKMNFSYDPEHDDLFIWNPLEKSHGAIELGDFVVDFNARKDLVGLQIFHVLEWAEMLSSTSPQSLLSSLQEVFIHVVRRNGYLMLCLELLCEKEDLKSVLCIPDIKETQVVLL